MNDKYVTIKKDDYEELAMGYCSYVKAKTRKETLFKDIKKIENEIYTLENIKNFVLFKRKLKNKISTLEDKVTYLREIFHELDQQCYCDHFGVRIAFSVKECHCSNENSKPAPA